MQLKQLEYFIRLAELEHMTKAAKQLHTSQPNLSYTINEFEKELGVPLFEKQGRNIKLNRFGHLYYRYAKEAVNTLQRGKENLDQLIDPNSGQVRLGFLYTLGSHFIPSLVKSFTNFHPRVQFEFSQSNTQRLLNDLIDERLDLTFNGYLEGYPQLQFDPILEESLVIVVPVNHPFAKRESLSLKEFASEKIVYFDRHSGLRPFLDQLWKDYHLEISPVVEVEEDHSILGFVSEGYGLAILPDIPSISAYKVKKLKIEEDFPHRKLYLVHRKNAYLSPIVSEFKTFILDQAKSSR